MNKYFFFRDSCSFYVSSIKGTFLRLLRNPLLPRGKEQGEGKGGRAEGINVFTRAQHNIASFYNQ